jgi:hypothetical protein
VSCFFHSASDLTTFSAVFSAMNAPHSDDNN